MELDQLEVFFVEDSGDLGTGLQDATLIAQGGGREVRFEIFDPVSFGSELASAIFNAWLFGGCYNATDSGGILLRVCVVDNRFEVEVFNLGTFVGTSAELRAILNQCLASISALRLSGGSPEASSVILETSIRGFRDLP
ncbi:hypothetical protein [Maricaulis sp.]|uniref:hypothetical protein n=1 Tax=Maricaulis sp. TaxID=1486257 RepID=UPI0026164BDE|nr:hypothetical protein [Maricaulis sp.]